ncbi:hemoglobin subunit beta-A-like [Solea senegalensis]|uniref:Hemoglobin subunit beta-A-like n=1 Tax=Solea senegalensis TaxID=28829 RepID=A0AAV6RJA1_SOLSE|nr:hemoglobin subunit beta-like [Solea senegalensis]KAG7505070.1 hemoglobin subunit beta-A-like [Solea senegalensis]
MVEWTDAERNAILALWAKIDVADIGPKALKRLLIVFPWTKRYFTSFGNLSTEVAINSNDKVSAHGKKVLSELDKAVKNMDNIKSVYSQLSVFHSEQLHVDPDNFRLLAECVTVEVGAKFSSAKFPPGFQAAWTKFLDVVVAALRKQYH